MAIMHTCMTGIVNSDYKIFVDKNGNDIGCVFSMLTKDGNKRIPVNVYVNNEDAIKLCHEELIQGSVAVVKGIIDIQFGNAFLARSFPDGEPTTHVELSSDMMIISDELYILMGQSYQKNISVSPICKLKNEETVDLYFDPEIDLPF